MTHTKNHHTGTGRKGDTIQTIQKGTMNFHRISNPIHRKLVHDVRCIQNPVTDPKLLQKSCLPDVFLVWSRCQLYYDQCRFPSRPVLNRTSLLFLRWTTAIFSVISWVSNLNWWSCSPSVFCHVLLKRDQWDWGQRLNRIPHALSIGCNLFSRNLLGAPNTTIWKRGNFVGFFADLQLSGLFESRDEQYKDKERIQQLLLFLSQCVADISLIFQYNLKKGKVSAYLHLKSLQISWRILWITTTRLVFFFSVTTPFPSLRASSWTPGTVMFLSRRSNCFYWSRNRIFVWPVVHDDYPFL